MESGGILVHENWRNVTIVPHGYFQSSRFKQTLGFFFAQCRGSSAAFNLRTVNRYRFDTPDHSIVISGGTNPTQATIDACHGAT
jgi:hypothetical protein